jgi:hypothetical protein
MRLGLAVVLAIIATVHHAGASAQKVTGALQPDGSLQGTLVSTVGNLTWHAERKTVHPGGPSSEHPHH